MLNHFGFPISYTIFRFVTIIKTSFMKKIIAILAVFAFVFVGLTLTNQSTTNNDSIYSKKFSSSNAHNFDLLRDGDIIFQSSQSDQCKAVQLATKSIYSHCGIIFKEGNEYFVWEAVQPVRRTPLKTWIKHGEKDHFVVKRLQNYDEIINDNIILKMKSVGKSFMGKDYDLTFDWTDDRIYCSELVWKIYDRALGIEVGKLQQLKEFDLTHPLVKEKLKERYGKNIPLDGLVVSPAAIFDNTELVTIMSN